MRMIIAHIKKNDDGWAEPQALDEHFGGVARRADSFADAFGSQVHGGWLKELPMAATRGGTSGSYDEESSLETKGCKMDYSTPKAELVEGVILLIDRSPVKHTKRINRPFYSDNQNMHRICRGIINGPQKNR